MANVFKARSLARFAVDHGYGIIAPLQLSYGIEPALDEQAWLAMGLDLLAACDLVIMPEGAIEHSPGCLEEYRYARLWGKPIRWVTTNEEGNWEWLAD